MSKSTKPPIPEVALQELMATRSGSVNPANFPEESFELYSIPAFDRGTPDIAFGSEIGSTKQIVQPGDVLLSKIVPHIRRAWVVGRTQDRRLIASGEWIVFRGNRFHGPYLRHLLTSDMFNREFMNTVSGIGGSLLRARPSHVAKIKIPLPPIDDQKRIAYLLSKVEGLIAQRKEHLRQLDELLKSVFLTMFGDPMANDKGWEIGPFAKIIEYARNGLSPAKGGTESGLVYTLSAVTGDHFQPIYKAAQFDRIHSKYFPNENDFLICRGNGNIELVGKAYFHPAVPENVMFPDTIIAARIQPGAINRPFLEAIWKTAFIRSQIEQSARTTNGTYKINQGTISALNVPYPPIQIQNRFGAIADSITAAQFSLRQQLSTTEQLFAGLSRQAFRGELDLSRILVPETVEALVNPERLLQTEVAAADSGFDLEVRSTTDTLASSNARKVMIAQWLNAYAQPLGTQKFTSDSLMKLVREKLSDLHTKDDALEIDCEVSAADYDHVKDWIFQHLESKHLTQLYDDANNRVQISGAKD